MNGFELQTCMAIVSIYLSLNILTMIPWIWIILYVTIQVLKRCLQMNLCFAFFSSPLFFDANRDWKEDISYLSSRVKRYYPCTYLYLIFIKPCKTILSMYISKIKIILQLKITDTLSRTERLPY